MMEMSGLAGSMVQGRRNNMQYKHKKVAQMCNGRAGKVNDPSEANLAKSIKES